MSQANLDLMKRFYERWLTTGEEFAWPWHGTGPCELTLAVRNGLRTGDLAGTIHPYPTYGDGPWNAAIDEVRGRLAGPATHAVTRLVVALRRR